MHSPASILRAEIAAAGSITFARFMEVALYLPGLGYYERRPDRIGRRGDYYTSVSVGPVFGELLAARFARWVRAVDAPQVALVELGPHDGRLARDILEALSVLAPDLLPRLEYCLVDASPARRAWQAEMLRSPPARVRWVNDLAELAPGSIAGVIFGNEFLDALPVHRVGWDAARREWFEWHVGWDGHRFCWVRPAVGGLLQALPTALRAALDVEYPHLGDPAMQAVLPDAFTVELAPAAWEVWAAAARALDAGWLVAIDYGFDATDAVRPERPGGTVRSYARHRVADDLLAEPGSQDLTAHVNFAALIAVGERAGLRTAGLVPQAAFLVEGLRDDAAAARWTAAQRRQFQTLVHPQHLGERFKALVQTRLPSPQ